MKRGDGKRAQRNQALLAALEAGDLAGAQQAVAQGADPRCDDDEPVCVAASTGDLALVKYLIETCGADLESRNRGVLRIAVQYSYLPIVKYLVEEREVDITRGNSDVPLDHALCMAATDGQLPVVRYLIEERGADPHIFDDDCVFWAAKGGHLAVVRYFIEEQNTDPRVRVNWLLREAADGGDPRIVRYLVEECGVDPRINDDEAIVAGAFGDGAEGGVVGYLARRIFATEAWRGRDRATIEAEVRALAAKIQAGPHLKPDEIRRAIEAIEREAALATYNRPK